VFERKFFSVEKSDFTPEKFRFDTELITEEETVEGDAELPQIESDDTKDVLAKSERQVTEFVKTKNETYRQIKDSKTISSKRFVSELGGGYATQEETYPTDPLEEGEEPTLGTLEDSVEDLGNGKNIRRTLKIEPKVGSDVPFFNEDGSDVSGVQTLPILRGQDYDEELDIVIPYKQVFADPKNKTFSEGDRRRVTPRDVTHNLVVKYDLKDVENSLNNYYWEVPDMIDVRLPDKLINLVLRADTNKTESESESDGDTYTLSSSERDSVGGTLSYEIEQGFSGVVPTVRAIFFLPKDAASPQAVLNTVASRSGRSVAFWPNIRTRGYQIAITETSNFKESSESVSFDSLATSKSTGREIKTQIVSIPPTIHSSISISAVSGEGGTVKAEPSSVGPTPDTIFPTGDYLYQINATPYKFSYVRVDALLVQITSEYV
jgi:hypothetical protein